MQQITPFKIVCVFLFLLFLVSCQHSHVTDIDQSGPLVNDMPRKGPGMFMEVHRQIRMLDGQDSPAYRTGDRFRALQSAKLAVKSSQSEDYDWIERGPSNSGGRTRGLIVDPRDTTARTWFSASVGGGIWYTEDAGETWELLSTEFTSLATSTIAMPLSNPDVLYVGTGENGFRNLDAIVGTGIWKSTDRGQSWRLLTSTSINEFSNVNRLIVNPQDENELYACTSYTNDFGDLTTRIYKTTDGGETWDFKYQRVNSSVQQLMAAPGDFDVVYATVNGQGVLRSVDGGETWNSVWSAQDGARRIEMAISPKDDGVIYLSCEVNDGSGLFYTRDTFNTVIKPIFQGRKPNWLFDQGWYDNTIAVHPYNDSIVWVAGQGPMLEIVTSQDSGVIKRFGSYNSLAPFITPIENSEFNDEPAGESRDLFGGTPVSLNTTDDDLVNVELRFGDGASSKAHLLNVDLIGFNFAFDRMIDVPFEAWDVTNNRQIALTVFDVDGDGRWTFDNYTGQSNVLHDVVTTNNIDYSETPDPEISGANPLHKSQYYIFLGRSPGYNGPQDDLPCGIIFFNTEVEEGLLGSFTPKVDGYLAYSDISTVGTKGVHVDHHGIIFLPRDSARGLFYVVNVNDGGVAFSQDGGETFTQTGDSFNDGNFTSLYGYNASQFYGIDKRNGESRYIGGTQDNGTWVSPKDPDSSSIWIGAPSGDGFDAAWHYDNPNLILETSQRNRLYKSYDEGESWRRVDLPQSIGPFITRLASSQLRPDLVFMVCDLGVLRSDDFAETWEVIDMPSNWRLELSWGTPVAISLADPDIVWSGSRVNNPQRMCYSTDGGVTFQPTNGYTAAETGLITGIETHPNEPNTAYIVSSQMGVPKVLVTNDLGNSWRDISGYGPDSDATGFPDVAVYSLLVMPWNDEMIWAGTEIGIFESLDGGETWAFANNGFPAVSVWQMKIVNDEIVVATHGRGIWTLNTEVFGVTSSTKETLLDHTELKLYPNPAQGFSNLEFELDETQKVEVSLLTMEGRKLRTVFSGEKGQGLHRMALNINDLDAGSYLVNFRTAEGQISKQLIVN